MTRGVRAALLAAAGAAVLALALMAGPAGFGWPDTGTAVGRAVLRLRLYRLATAFTVGAGLAAAGVVLQALLRNPLADPYVLGVSSGGALGAALAILTGLAAFSPAVLPAAAFVTALATLALVYALANRPAGPSIYGLLLSGVIVSALASSLLMLLVSLAPVEGLHEITWWMLGSLEVASPRLLAVAAGAVGASLLLFLFLARDLNALTLGREMAHHVGVRTRVAVGLGLAGATLASAAAVSLAGLVGFVGLVVPHAVRTLTGADHRRLLPAAALGGGFFLVGCDAVARSLFAPVDIPVGVLTALTGGPFFLYLLRSRRHGWVE